MRIRPLLLTTVNNNIPITLTLSITTTLLRLKPHLLHILHRHRNNRCLV